MKTKLTSTLTSLFALVLASCLVLGMTDVQAQLDYGDAPDIPYATLSANNGARHMAIGPLLGLVRDSEADGQPNTTATGDDIVGSPDDEDGVSFPDILFPGFADNKVSVRTSGTGPFILNAWMDFNGDGDWSDAGEQIFTDRPLVLGANSLLYTVPPGALPPQVYSRWRLNTTGGISFDGSAADGEVEDYCHGSIHGQKWHDRNQDGKRDLATEEGLNGFEIQLWDPTDTTLKAFVGTHDLDHDMVPGIDPYTERGIYWIHGVPPGFWILREKEVANSLQTFPAKCGSKKYRVRANCRRLGRTPPEQPPVCGPGPHWLDNCVPDIDEFYTVATVYVQGGPFGPDPVPLFGAGDSDTIIKREPHQNSGLPGGHAGDTVPIELVELSLQGVVPIEVGGGLGGQPFQLRGGSGLGLPSIQGEATEIPNDDFHVDSFFDVFVEIEIDGFPTLHNNAPLTVQAIIDQIPPTSDFVKVPGQPIPLLDPGDAPSGIQITNVVHKPIYGLDFGGVIIENRVSTRNPLTTVLENQIKKQKKKIKKAKKQKKKTKAKRLTKKLKKLLKQLRAL